MSSEWPAILVRDVATLNDESWSPREGWDFISYLDTGAITENRISNIETLVPGQDQIPSRARRKVQPGDIIYSTVRPNQRHFGLIRQPPPNLLVSTGFTVVRTKEPAVLPEYLYWFLAQDETTDLLQAIAETSTSAYPSIRADDIGNLTLHLPPMPEQRAIARVLGALDRRMEMNRRMNRTLEQTARAISEDWFRNSGPGRAPTLHEPPKVEGNLTR